MRSAVLFYLLLFACRFAKADSPPPQVAGGEVATEETDLARRLSDALREDAAMRQALAQRILQSSLAKKLSSSDDPEKAAAEVEDWIRQHPDDAAHLKIGFAQDDFYGTHAFEHSLYERVARYFQLNPKREKGILGVIEAAGSQSQFLLQHEKKLDAEEQRDLIKSIFEGGSPGGQLHAPEPHGRPRDPLAGHPPGASGPAVFVGSIYDRLSTVNLTGYSPEVLTLQNSLNAQHVPGAPHIPETGRLDYATLAFPYYLLRYDLGVLDGASQKDRKRADVSSPREREREKALRLAAQALQKFRREADTSKVASQISPSLLQSLSRRQKETARWITIASLEADLEHLSAADRWPEELLEKIRAAPVDEAVRRSYLEEGKRLLDRASRVKEADAGAIEALQGSDFLARWRDAQARLAQAAALRSNLSQNAALYARTPYLFPEAAAPKPWWRALLDRWISFLLPNTDYSRRLRNEENRRKSAETAFEQIASGDYSGAQESLAKGQVL